MKRSPDDPDFSGMHRFHSTSIKCQLAPLLALPNRHSSRPAQASVFSPLWFLDAPQRHNQLLPAFCFLLIVCGVASWASLGVVILTSFGRLGVPSHLTDDNESR